MKATASDNKIAWDIAKEFLENENEMYLFLQMDSDYQKSGYTVVKLPYGENIYLLYAMSWHDKNLNPGIDLKYAGFYSRQNKQSYNLREPINHFFEFDGIRIYESELKKTVIEAVQRTVAEKIADKAEEFSGLSVNDCDVEIIRDAETAFSKKEKTLDFASKINISEYYISELSMVDYIDSPENIHNPNSILKRYVDEQINGKEEKLARLWAAHCVSQKILDRLYTEYEEEKSDG